MSVPESSDQPLLESDVQGYRLELFDAVSGIAARWRRALVRRDIFMEPRFLGVLEAFPPEDLHPCYVLCSCNGAERGVIYFQVRHFNAGRSLNYRSRAVAPFRRIEQTISKRLASLLDFYTLVNGNLLATGEHGFQFSEEVSEEDRCLLLQHAIQMASRWTAESGRTAKLLFIKDLDAAGRLYNAHFFGRYHRFEAEPNMVLTLSPAWRNIQDYSNDLTSKYRVRMRRARKLAAGLNRRELTTDDTEQLVRRIHSLYLMVAGEAQFNLFLLNERYFAELKKALGSAVLVQGYFDKDTLVGYSTLIFNGSDATAHFLGFDRDVNIRRQLYLNMLYDMIEASIERKCERVILGRTALEIKSSVGAVPLPMDIYLSHHTPFYNKILPTVYAALSPQRPWTPRHPFRLRD